MYNYLSIYLCNYLSFIFFSIYPTYLYIFIVRIPKCITLERNINLLIYLSLDEVYCKDLTATNQTVWSSWNIPVLVVVGVVVLGALTLLCLAIAKITRKVEHVCFLTFVFNITQKIPSFYSICAEPLREALGSSFKVFGCLLVLILCVF